MSSRRSSIAVGHVEVAVDDDVEDRPEREPFVVVALAPRWRSKRRSASSIGTGPPRRPLADREQPPVAEHDVDLADDELVARSSAVVHGDVVVVGEPLELGALMRVDEVLGGQVVDPELLGEACAPRRASGCRRRRAGASPASRAPDPWTPGRSLLSPRPPRGSARLGSRCEIRARVEASRGSCTRGRRRRRRCGRGRGGVVVVVGAGAPVPRPILVLVYRVALGPLLRLGFLTRLHDRAGRTPRRSRCGRPPAASPARSGAWGRRRTRSRG